MSESRFDTATDPSRKDALDYINPISRNEYEFMTDTYRGQGGYRNGNYLVPHDREMFYSKRKQISAYKNFLQPILNSMVDPVYAQEIPRPVTDGSGNLIEEGLLFHDFLDDVDCLGTGMQAYAHRTMIWARLHGMVATIMDNFEEVPNSYELARADRTYPYLITRTANEIVEYKVDEKGRIVSITFQEPDRKNGKTVYKRRREWTANRVVVYEKLSTQLVTVSGKANGYRPVSTYEHNLGEIPVRITYSVMRDDLSTVFVSPPLYDIGRVCHLIYNKDSELRDNERSQAFAILYIQGDLDKNLTIGPHNIIGVSMDVSLAPGYVQPNPQILATLMENNKVHVQDLYRLAEQNGVIAVEKAESGVAKGYDFFAHERQLQKTSSMGMDWEEWVARMWKLYTNEEFDYTPAYQFDFQPGDRFKEIQALTGMLSSNLPQPIVDEIHKKIAHLLMAEEDVGRIAEVIAEIERSNAPAPVPVEEPTAP